METVLVAAVQATPVFLDRQATVEKACRLIVEAGSNGAGLTVLPEAFVPTYPDWVWRVPPWKNGSVLFRLLLENSVEVPSSATDALGDAARQARVYACVGVNECDGSTLYNTLLYFGPDGSIIGKHRKLMPTGAERLVWGMGDGSTLQVVETPFGRVGGLICWEQYMPLARYAMYAQGIDILLAPTWDNSDMWVCTLRHNAKEGRCYVVGVGSVLNGSHVPAAIPCREELYTDEDDWMCRGYSAIVGPDGTLLAGPLLDKEGILYATLDAAQARACRHEFDPVGHYCRPDIFQLQVDVGAKTPVRFRGDNQQAPEHQDLETGEA